MTDGQRIALETYVKERKQAAYRLVLLREAERDFRNKKDDYETSHERAETALANLIAECDQ